MESPLNPAQFYCGTSQKHPVEAIRVILSFDLFLDTNVQ